MKFDKMPISISEQIEKLIDRGLRFDDVLIAQNYLSNISYYRLRAYTFPFQDNEIENQPFNVDISFNQIIDLYFFDRKLRLYMGDRFVTQRVNNTHPPTM